MTLKASLGAIAGVATAPLQTRPKALELISLAALFQEFSTSFLGGNQEKHQFTIASGHVVDVFDHNFFHLVKLSHSERGQKFHIRSERPRILAQTVGFGDYAVEQTRAAYLPAAFDTLCDPDQIVEHPELDTATHVLCKQYHNGGVTPTTIVMVKLQKGVFIPVTSFAVKNRKAKQWCRDGQIIWSRTSP